MKTLSVFISLLLLATGFSPADDTMTRVVFRQEAPDVTPDSFAAKPKTLYLWGTDRGRVEEAPDPEHQLHGLIIANGKDGWMINLYTNTATHFIDPGPTYHFYAPIVPQEKSGGRQPVKDFQIGHELEFMKSHHSGGKISLQVGGPSFLSYSCEQEGYTLQLRADPVTGLPTESAVLKDGKPIVRLIYSEYKTSLPGAPSLFQPPPGVKISEAKP